MSDTRHILGYFWNNLFQDTWLIDNIQKLCQSVISPKTQYLVGTIKKHFFISSDSQSALQDFPDSIIISADAQQTITNVNTIYIAQSQSSCLPSSEIGKVDTQRLKYKILSGAVATGDVLYKTNQTTETLDCSYSTQQSYLILPAGYDVSKLQTYIYQQDGQLYKTFKLWRRCPFKLFQVDRFYKILDLPKQWSITHRDVVYTLWKAYICGMTVKTLQDILLMLDSSAKVIFDYSDATDSSIPIITGSGMLNAQNTTHYNCSCLPLTGNITKVNSYKQKCAKLYLTAPYRCQVPSTVNAMQFLLQKVFKNRFVIIKYSNSQVTPVLDCITKLIPAELAVIIVSTNQIQKPLSLNVKHVDAIVSYYDKSVNNNYEWSYDDYHRQWL